MTANVGTLGDEMALGLTLTDINILDDQYSIWERSSLVEKLRKRKEMDNLLFVLDIVEGLYAAGAALMSPKNYKLYKKWHRSKTNRIRKLTGAKKPTIWEHISKSRRL